MKQIAKWLLIDIVIVAGLLIATTVYCDHFWPRDTNVKPLWRN